MTEPGEGTSREEAILVAEVHVDGHRLGLLVSDVREVLRAAAVSPLPGAPAVVAGLLNVRGALLPVYDLRQRIGATPRPIAPSDHLVIANAGREVVLAVDAVRSLVAIPADRIDAASRLPVDSYGVGAVARLEDGLLIILDLRRFLTEAETVALDAALAG